MVNEPTMAGPSREPDPIGRRWREKLTRRRQRLLGPATSRAAGPRRSAADGSGGGDSAPPSPKLTAFVLAGGGTRGAAQVGMLAELVDRGITADRVYGASVGAVNGGAYCGDPTPGGVERLADVWRSLSGETVFPKSRVHGPWMFFQQRPSVHANSGLRRVVTSGLTFERLEDAPLPLEVVTTSLTDGRERWLTSGPAVDAIVASAAIPALFPPVEIDGELLVDGGVVNNVPIARPLQAGATDIYVLLCGPMHYKPEPPKRPAEAVLAAFFVAVHARFARELSLLPPGVTVTVFSGPGKPSGEYRDFSGTDDLIEAGRAEAAAVLDAQRATVTGPSAGSPSQPAGEMVW